jgi:hypothetical protein
LKSFFDVLFARKIFGLFRFLAGAAAQAGRPPYQCGGRGRRFRVFWFPTWQNQLA